MSKHVIVSKLLNISYTRIHANQQQLLPVYVMTTFTVTLQLRIYILHITGNNILFTRGPHAHDNHHFDCCRHCQKRPFQFYGPLSSHYNLTKHSLNRQMPQDVDYLLYASTTFKSQINSPGPYLDLEGKIRKF